MKLGKGHTIRLWLRVDREAKLFKVLGYDHCDPDSCTDGIVAQYYSRMNDGNEVVQMGEWPVRFDSQQQTDEYSLNALNTVMRSINFLKEGVNIANAGDDVGKNMTFYFPKPTPTTSVCKGLVPTLPDNTAGQIEEATRFFSAPPAAFRSAADKSAQHVTYTATFGTINRVETLLERFDAEVTVQLWWQITKADAVEYGKSVLLFLRRRWSSSLGTCCGVHWAIPCQL